MLDLDDCAFEGPYAELYRQFVSFKRAMGYKYGEGVLYDLRRISEEIEGARTDEEGPLPQKLVMDWTERKPGESDANRKKRLTLMRQLGLFVEGLGIECFVLPERFIPAKGPRYEPYIFTEDEISALMAHFDSLPHDRRFPNRSKVQPVLLRTIYGCGTRIREALDLKVWEVDVENGVLSINNAKGGKRRYLPMSPSLASCFASYWDEMGLDGAPPDAPVFPSVKRGGLLRQRLHQALVQMRLRQAGDQDGEGAVPPRPRPSPHICVPLPRPLHKRRRRPLRDAAGPRRVHGPQQHLRHRVLPPPD